MERSKQTTKKSWALITGASSGIGAAFAKRIARDGYNVVLVARRQDRLERLAAEISARSNVETMVVPLNLTCHDAPSQLMTLLQSKEIIVDIFLNNAGFGINGEFCDIDITRQLQMVDLNCRSLIVLSQAVARTMKERRRGTIIHTASIGGLFPTPYYSIYGATKAFVVAFSEGLAVELAPFDVRVLTLCPGATETEFESVSEFKGIRPPQYGFETAEDVAETAMHAMKRPPSLVISGRHNQWMTCLMRLMPRPVSLSLAARSMKPLA